MYIDNYDFLSDMIYETVNIRNTTNLGNDFIVLAEPSESIIFMDTCNKPSVIWCDGNTNIKNINERNYTESIETWETYTEYINAVVNEELDDLMNL